MENKGNIRDIEILGRGTVLQGIPGTDRQSCAFPQVEVLPCGRWLVSCRVASTKGGSEGQRVMLAASDDEGRSWRFDEFPYLPPDIEGKPGQFRALALTALGGRRVLATLYRVDCSDPALPLFNEKTEGLLDSRIMFSESGDNGETWSPPTLVDTAPFTMPTPITGPVLLMPGGEWACQFETNKAYHDESRWVHSSVLMFSADGGRTWPRYSVVTRDEHIFYWDQRPRVLPGGRIFDLFWVYDTRATTYLNIHARESADGGRSWTVLRDTGVPGQPAPVVPLRDGRLAMVHVDRTGAPAVRCRFSSDDGRTWPEQGMLTIYESLLPGQNVSKKGMSDAWSEMGRFSVGLPATAALPGGDFLVVYYAGPDTDLTSVEWVRAGQARK